MLDRCSRWLEEVGVWRERGRARAKERRRLWSCRMSYPRSLELFRPASPILSSVVTGTRKDEIYPPGVDVYN